MNSQNYIKQSLELHLVFLRLMKEHALIIMASLPQKNQNLIKEAKAYNTRYNALLTEAVSLSKDVLGMSNAAVTEFTLEIEEKTQRLLGIPIDMELTKTELSFPKPKRLSRLPTEESIAALNKKIVDLTEQFVLFKTRAIDAILECEIYSSTYPELIIHNRFEALDYIDKTNSIERREQKTLTNEDIMNWNHIMLEHAQFVRGLLDPTEEELIEIANKFAMEGKAITLGPNLYERSLEFVEEIRDFKKQATKLILECDVRSIINPIISDHILREANYYLNNLRMYNN